ncbi:MAG TPA: peptidylprolyl isomerase [Gammaproteobacteria bacterium]|jgi:FKBP-type peptidyl-prolyl cis-trans isomerase SlyD|nr:peptidylprolyl isomerase [Gammaproteobacteria bacterium]MDP6732397.1 peptidylprolyl isomerase [Gammaproteobacteria bacterium]HAJ76307.1 peptidylprolyl isomerase [Gammaproteobacteria bacterium]|tara:strand:- start:636 stop:1202 length:567 start_codon:yes stop_codon:yes gene_type:complete
MTDLDNSEDTRDSERDSQTPEQITANKVVSFHYRLSEVDGEGNHGDWSEQSYGNEPLYYLHGFHNVIVGLEKVLEGKTVGDKIEITLKPEEAYGERDPEGIRRLPIKKLRFLRGGKKPKPGMLAVVETKQGKCSVIILKVGKFNVDVDFNHPLAGRTLYYEVEVVSVRDASEEEIAQGHVHGARGHNL